MRHVRTITAMLGLLAGIVPTQAQTGDGADGLPTALRVITGSSIYRQGDVNAISDHYPVELEIGNRGSAAP